MTGQQINICSWNVNGLRAVHKKGALAEFLSKENPDILCLNETKISEDILKKEKLDKLFSDQYGSYWNCSKTKAGYAGVAIFTKYQPENIIYGIDHDDHDDEGRVITLEFNNFFLISVYVPNAGEGLKRLDYRVKEWDVEFQNFLKNLTKKKDIILCGDLNVAHKEIDIFSPKTNLKTSGFTIEERNSFESFLNDGYVDTFRHLNPKLVKYSYFTKRFGRKNIEENKGWRLDYFVINSQALERLDDSDILNEYEASDHCPIKLLWKI